MRLLLLGLDADGRSCIAQETDIVPAPIEGVRGAAVAPLFSTSQSPPPACASGPGKAVPDRLAPGIVQWYLVEHAAPETAAEQSAATELHHRNAIDLIVLMDGTAELLLGDGSHPVMSGDCIVMAGVDHGLRPGPSGCRLLSFAIGTPPPE